MFTTVCSAAVYGLQAYLVRVEVDLAGPTVSLINPTWLFMKVWV